MFDAISIRRTQQPLHGTLDLGSLAEAILFYERVTLLIDRGALVTLLTTWGPELTVEMVEGGYLTPLYAHWTTAVLSDTVSGERLHKPTTMRLFTGEHDTYEHEVRDIWTQYAGRNGKQRRLRDRFLRVTVPFPPPDGLIEVANADFLDESYLLSAVPAVLAVVAPTYELPSPLEFRPEPRGDELISVQTNLDFDAIARAQDEARPTSEPDPWTVAHTLSEIFGATTDLQVGATLETATLGSDLASQLIQLRTSAALSSTGPRSQIERFQHFAFDDGRDIRGVLNSGERTMREFQLILDRSRDFRTWLHTRPDDADLAREYLRASLKGSWAERLPAKAIRWAVMTALAIGAPDPIALPAGIGAMDMFLVNKMAAGWRPSQFVEARLSPFVAKRKRGG